MLWKLTPEQFDRFIPGAAADTDCAVRRCGVSACAFRLLIFGAQFRSNCGFLPAVVAQEQWMQSVIDERTRRSVRSVTSVTAPSPYLCFLERDRDRLGGVMTQKIKIDRYDFVIVLAVATFVVVAISLVLT
jgi:hypothetical protein